MKATIYVRISSDRTGEAAGVDRQRLDCERLVKDRGWTLAGIETDNDISATTGRRRPGFERLLAGIESGQTQVVVAWALDRLQRNKHDELRLYDLCKAKGVRLSLVNGSDIDFSNAAGLYVADMLGATARFEVNMKSDRQRRAQEQAAHAGRRSGGRRPFGYDADGMNIREDEAEAIRTGYSDLLAGASIGSIARSWNAAGFHTAQARRTEGHEGEPSPWRNSSVRDVLKNPRYAGRRRYKGEEVAKAVWPAIVEEETFRAAEAILNDPARRTAPNAGRALLSGVALCGVCGATLHAGGANRPGIRNYRCSGSMGHVSRRAEPVEDYVTAVILARLSRPDARGLLIDKNRPNAKALRTQANALRAKLEGLAVDYAEDRLTWAQMNIINERTRARLAEVETEMADAGRVDVLGPLIAAADPENYWLTMDTDRRRLVIDILATVQVYPPGRGVRTFNPDTVIVTPKEQK